MNKGRLEAFSDGVIAILITIMVLELKVPHGASWASLQPLLPVFLSYVLSFVYLGIYWNNHHHLFQVCERIGAGTMWANLHLLFWLSLIPFATGWMGENHFAPLPTAAYGAILLLSGLAYTLLVRAMLRLHGRDSKLAAAIGSDRKGWASLVLYAIAIPMAFVHRGVSEGIYVLVAAIWLIPDRRIEAVLPGERAA
jgi:uncharacterized membrane protein